MAKKVEQKANVSKVLPCDCSNHTQDKKYGHNNRIHHRCKEGWRCGACRKVKLTS